ncbi:hypothetical protein M3699_05045 [Peribacillus simplex]|uniref:hypothetical protein n=1 Tax=Peribacillus simplex TaxID=1478 RepID=UPI00203E86C2|nr:hypothetical protein [Peribacillus simplex]MCM3673261.1 hypothetical protein [Peribacillus simplex]
MTDPDTVNNKVKNNAIQSVNVNVDLDILFGIIFLIFSEGNGNGNKSFSEDSIAKAMAMVKNLKKLEGGEFAPPSSFHFNQLFITVFCFWFLRSC